MWVDSKSAQHETSAHQVKIKAVKQQQAAAKSSVLPSEPFCFFGGLN